MKDGTRNNFDLIRLFAATQVALSHITGHLGFESPLISFLSLFPGVPIFFFVSGYLIYGSYEQSTKSLNTNLNFFVKRFLRIFPALWLCFLISIISIWYSGFFEKVSFTTVEFLTWSITQNTIFQFYNPDFMRAYGVGVINGILWTICVEIQFYLLTPFIFFFLNKFKFGLIGIVLLILTCINLLNANLNDGSNVYYKLFSVSFMPWLYMFMLGSLAYKYPSIASAVKRVHFLGLFSIFLARYFLTRDLGWGNNINPISYLLVAMLTLKSAYTLPSLSDKMLKKNDISYGVYIFHMPIVNYLLYQNITGFVGALLATSLTFFIATLSWFMFEKKILSLKKYALRKN
jgi:peptidoglycan/LPS O-acetylase OafA/YrhL